MIKRDWLLGVGLLSGSLGLGLQPVLSQPALAQGEGGAIGKVAAVKPDAFGAAPTAPEQVLAIGAGVVENEKIRTSPDGTANVMFADHSTLTVGKGSEVTLDKFVYDPATRSGGLAIDLAQGTLRFVGGQLSKSGSVQVKTPTATMTIRGGIALFSFPPGQTGYAVFLYGKELKDLGSGQSIFRPGFVFKYPADGGPPEMVPLTDELLAQILQNFNTTTGLGGSIPDEDLANFENQLGDPLFQERIADLRDQIDGLSNKDNPIFESIKNAPPVVVETYDPYGS